MCGATACGAMRRRDPYRDARGIRRAQGAARGGASARHGDDRGRLPRAAPCAGASPRRREGLGGCAGGCRRSGSGKFSFGLKADAPRSGGSGDGQAQLGAGVVGPPGGAPPAAGGVHHARAGARSRLPAPSGNAPPAYRCSGAAGCPPYGAPGRRAPAVAVPPALAGASEGRPREAASGRCRIARSAPGPAARVRRCRGCRL